MLEDIENPTFEEKAREFKDSCRIMDGKLKERENRLECSFDGLELSLFESGGAHLKSTSKLEQGKVIVGGAEIGELESVDVEEEGFYTIFKIKGENSDIGVSRPSESRATYFQHRVHL